MQARNVFFSGTYTSFKCLVFFSVYSKMLPHSICPVQIQYIFDEDSAFFKTSLLTWYITDTENYDFNKKDFVY